MGVSDPPTNLFCGNDPMAMGAYETLKEAGLCIPEDVAVV
jgi:LacI family transcriptional regulator